MSAPGQLALGLGHRSARGREDFLVAPSNADAVQWIDRWNAWPRHMLAIHGPPGCGKSHLAEVWRQAAAARTVAGSDIGSWDGGAGDTPAALVVEDGDRGIDEEGLLHLYNSLAEAGGFLLLTGREPPARWPVALPDMRSRLRSVTAVEIGRPDDSLLAAVLGKLFGERQLRVSEEVVPYLVARLERSFAAARACVAALDEYALAARRNITVPLCREALGPLSEAQAATVGDEA